MAEARKLINPEFYRYWIETYISNPYDKSDIELAELEDLWFRCGKTLPSPAEYTRMLQDMVRQSEEAKARTLAATKKKTKKRRFFHFGENK